MKTNTFSELGFRSRITFRWIKLASLAVLASYFYVFMEWLFFVTKPSFMDFLPFAAKLGIFLLTGLLLAGASLLGLLVLFAAAALARRWRFASLFLWAGSLIAGGFLAATALLLIDNFTYTVFKFGIVTSTGYQRGLYGLLFVLLLAGAAWQAGRAAAGPEPARQPARAIRPETIAAAALLILSVPLSAYLYLSNRAVDPLTLASKAARRPNILLVGSDGVDASHLSLYGYERDTTPFLKTFARQSLLAENNFTNASVTSGSLISMFTGKLPTQTRLLYPPDILKGEDAFQHFPGILRREGYYTDQISVDYYADADSLNLKNAFVVVNYRTVNTGWLYTRALRYIPENAAYFLSTIVKRLTDRIYHIYYVRVMANPYAQATIPMNAQSDEQRVQAILQVFRDVRQPIFMQVHLMGTHVGIMNPRKQVFFKGDRVTDANVMDVYDDAILSFDSYIEELAAGLAGMGKLDHTILILYTDHGYGNAMNIRLPLLMRFPNGEYAGTLRHNTQNLDIAPTVLDYMGIQPPAWMSGQSLLKGEPPAARPIFTAAPNYRRLNRSQDGLELDLSKIKPPFYQFGTIGMAICQRWYSVDTATLKWKEEDIAGYPSPCAPEALPGDAQAQQMMLERLNADGFDTAGLRAALEKK